MMNSESEKNVDLSIKLGRISLNNPILVAAGTFGFGEEYAKLIDLNKLGGIITKTVTLEPSLSRDTCWTSQCYRIRKSGNRCFS
jgi:dihydroorotate dehydrogenase (NAD+) catalytic subunit